MKEDHETTDQPSPAVREKLEHPLTDAELQLVSGGACPGLSFIGRNGRERCIGK